MVEEKKEEKSGNAGEDSVTIHLDARVMWFEDKVCGAFKLKSDKFKKLTSTSEFV
jgi:hypothetical protein